MLFKHYIWDFDGTLADSYPHIIRLFADTLTEEGIHADEERLAKLFYRNFKTTREETGISDEAYARFIRRHDTTGEDETDPPVVPFPEIDGILRKIAEAGGIHYIYTNRNTTVLYYCKKFGWDGMFRDVITCEDDFPMKPAPDALLDLMKRHGLRPEECVMIGDREIDGLSGVNAGMAGCLVTDKTEDMDGNDPLAVSVLPFKCRKFSDLLTLFEVETTE